MIYDTISPFLATILPDFSIKKNTKKGTFLQFKDKVTELGNRSYNLIMSYQPSLFIHDGL